MANHRGSGGAAIKTIPKNCCQCGAAYGTRDESIVLCPECRRLRDKSNVARHIRQEERESAARIRELNNPKPRTCLGCGHQFASAGPFNRLCAECKQKHFHRDDPAPRRVPSLSPLAKIKMNEFLYQADSEETEA